MKRGRSLVAGILAIALAPPPAHPQATPGGEWRDDVGWFAPSLVDAQLVPGMGIAVTQGDRVVYWDTRRQDVEADHKREQLEAHGWTLASQANDLASKVSPRAGLASS